MKASMFYRIAAVLLLLFDAGHTSGFPWSDPKWAVDIGSMRSTHFYIMGFSRTYWDFYVGFGLFVSVFLLLAMVLAWQLGGLPPESLALMLVFQAEDGIRVLYVTGVQTCSSD